MADFSNVKVGDKIKYYSRWGGLFAFSNRYRSNAKTIQR